MRLLTALFGLIGFAAAVWAFADAERIPARHWEATGRTKPHWLGLIFVTFFLGLWFVGVGIYVLGPRRDLKKRQRAQEESRHDLMRDMAQARRAAPDTPDLGGAARRLRRDRPPEP